MAQKDYERVTLNESLAPAATATTLTPEIEQVAPISEADWIKYYRDFDYGLMLCIVFPDIMLLQSLVIWCLSRKNRPIENEDLAFVLFMVTRYKRDGQIGVKEFINWINWIDGMREMIDNLQNMFYETTWHGEYLLNCFRMTSTDAENALEGSPEYTIVLRWSLSSIGCLAVSYIKKGGKISHLLIKYTKYGWSIAEDGKEPEIYPDLKELIEKCDEFGAFVRGYPKEYMAPSHYKANQMIEINKAAMATKAAAKAAAMAAAAAVQDLAVVQGSAVVQDSAAI